MDCQRSVLLDQIPLKLDREGIKEREDDEKGSGVGGDDYTREAIIFNISFLQSEKKVIEISLSRTLIGLK